MKCEKCGAENQGKTSKAHIGKSSNRHSYDIKTKVALRKKPMSICISMSGPAQSRKIEILFLKNRTSMFSKICDLVLDMIFIHLTHMNIENPCPLLFPSYLLFGCCMVIREIVWLCHAGIGAARVNISW